MPRKVVSLHKGRDDRISGDDRLSGLPDDILCHILSFVSSSDAVRTAVLSTKWKTLWTGTTNLDIDDTFLSRICGKSKHKQRKIEQRFIKYVNGRINQLNVSGVGKLRLHSVNVSVKVVSSWMRDAVKNNFWYLDLQLSQDHRTLPMELFRSSSLQVLKLQTDYLEFPTVIPFMNLKTLHLSVKKFKNGWDLGHLLQACPAIEELHIIRRDAEVKEPLLKISLPKLKSFHLEFLSRSPEQKLAMTYELKINAPNLMFLHVEDHLTRFFTVKDLRCLVKAHIDWVPTETVYLEEYHEQCGQVIELLEGMSTVQSLFMSARVVSSLRFASSFNKPTLRDLKYLELSVAGDLGYQFLADFLHCTPQLEVLVLINKDDINDICPLDEHWHPPDIVPSCILSHLREIVGEGLREDFEFEALEYLLEQCLVLKKLTVKYGYSASEEETFAFFEGLQRIPRGSPTCEVTMVSSCRA